MALSAPAEREAMHARRYDFRGFRRADGLWDIEGRIVDTKDYSFENRDRGEIRPGEPLHDMAVRLTLDDRMTVRDIEAVTEAGPFTICPVIAANYRKLIGKRVGRGWRAALRETMGGTEGCTHITEMLGAMATVAFQTIFPARDSESRTRSADKAGARDDKRDDKAALLLNTCHAFASDSPVVRREWPAHYTGPDQPETSGDGTL